MSIVDGMCKPASQQQRKGGALEELPLWAACSHRLETRSQLASPGGVRVHIPAHVCGGPSPHAFTHCCGLNHSQYEQ